MAIDTLLSVFKISNIIHWIIEVPSFILKPIKYIPVFFQKNREEKALQTLFYLTCALIIRYTFMVGVNLSSFIKLTLLEFLLLLPFFVTIFLTNYLLRRYSKSTLTNAQIISFLIIYRSFATIFMTLMSFLFLKTEHYLFHLIYNICFISLSFFLSFYSVRIFHERVRYIIIGTIFSYIITNTQAIVFDKILSYDSFTDNIPNLIPEDPIYNEYQTTLETVSDYVFIIPKARLSVTRGENKSANCLILSEYYIENRFNAFDTIINLGRDHLHNLLIIKKRLDTLVPKLQYKRNKSIFMKLSRYTDNEIKTHSNSFNDTISVKCFSNFNLTDAKNKSIGTAKFYRLPATIKNPLDSAISEIETLVDKSNSSEIILDYGLLLMYYPKYMVDK